MPQVVSLRDYESFPLPVVTSVEAVRDTIGKWRMAGKRVALVPTMGALHDGHMSPVKVAQRNADKVVVSVFVNPTQFGPGEDFDSYPRKEREDAEFLAQHGVDLLYLPNTDDMYPAGFASSVTVAARITEGLCAEQRPGHFVGVATVVAKLFLQTLPDVAVFGEKDYQQLLTLKQMMRDLNFPVEIVHAPTVREADGLAMSSRNAYLSESDRAIASHLPRILKEVVEMIAKRHVATDMVLAQGIDSVLNAGFDSVDYMELRDSENLAPVAEVVRPARVLVAARIGRVRLIDNMEVPV